MIIDNGDCSVTSSCFDISTVGLDENEIQTINVFPNPTSGMITINSSAQFNKVEVLNALGQKVGEYDFIETSNYSFILPEEKGVYMV